MKYIQMTCFVLALGLATNSLAYNYLGDMLYTSADKCPDKSWMEASGQLLQINQNQMLYSVMGNYFGGDGEKTFALPKLNKNAGKRVSFDSDKPDPHITLSTKKYKLACIAVIGVFPSR